MCSLFRILTCDSVGTVNDSLTSSGVEGSFYGLPHVVKSLLETERGIRDLYGNPKHWHVIKFS